MLTKVRSCTIIGVEGIFVEIAIELIHGTAECAVDFAGADIRYMKERIRSSFNASGYFFPCGRLTITLTPAGPPEGGAAFALALAVSILQASQQITANADLTKCLFLGSLSRIGQY